MKRSTIIQLLAFAILSGVIVVSFVSVCGYTFVPHCPIFAPREACLGVDEALLVELEPYVADWATRPAGETRQQRKEYVQQSEDILLVDVLTLSASTAGIRQQTAIVEVYTDGWFDWNHGYLYVANGADLGNTWKNGALTRINEHWYLFNYND